MNEISKDINNFSLPLVSIITVVRNGESTIEETIKSIRDQSYENIEYIIIDGKSSDSTLNIINKFSNLINVLVSEKDDGIYDAMNKGIEIANGEIIGILNADDLYRPNTVQLVIDEFSSNPMLDYCYGSISLVDTSGLNCGVVTPPPRNKWKNKVLRETIVPHPSLFVRKKSYEKFGKYDSTLKLAGDFELISRFHLSGALGVEIHAVLAEFRLGGRSNAIKILLEKKIIANKMGLNKVISEFDFIASSFILYLKKILPNSFVGWLRTKKELFY